MEKVRFGVSLPQIKRSWDETRAACQEFEHLGFHSVWLNDHLYGIPLPHIPILESWTTLSCAGALTSKVELGTQVSPVGFRSPALLAKMVATLDHITGGRVIIGLGCGWYEMEYRGYGIPFPPVRTRLEQLEEAITLMKRMWTEDTPTFVGKHFRTDSVFCLPRPLRQPHPPIMVGGGGEKILLRIAARHADIWNNLAVHQGQLAHKIALLKDHCRQVRRDFESLEISQQAVVVIGENEKDACAKMEKAKNIYGGHLGDIEAHGIWGSPEQCVDKIRPLVALGCRLFVIEFFGRDTREPARLFAREVLPAFQN